MPFFYFLALMLKRTASYIYLICIVLFLGCEKVNDPDPDPDPNPPPVADFGKIIFLQDTVRVYNTATGDVITNLPGATLVGSYINTATIHDTLIYQPSTNQLLAFSTKTGKRVFTYIFTFTGYSNGGVTASWPIIEGNNLYTTGIDAGGGSIRLTNHHRLTGNLIYKSDFSVSNEFVPPYPHHPTPALFGDKIFMTRWVELAGGTEYHGVIGFDKNTGAKLWYIEDFNLYRQMNRFPLVHDNKLIVFSRYNKTVYALNPDNGNVIWSRQLTGTYLQDVELKIAGSQVIVQAWEDGIIFHYLDIATGNLVKSKKHAGEYFAGYDDNHYYIRSHVSEGKFLRKFDYATNTEQWSKEFPTGMLDVPTITDKYIFLLVYTGNPWQQQLKILDKQTGALLKTTTLVPGLTFGRFIVIDKDGKGFTTYRGVG